MTDDSSGSLRDLLRSGSGVAVAMAVMNIATYGFTILAARLLGPSEYGAVASLMGLLLILNVLSLGLQATGARRIATDPGRRDEIEAGVISATYRSALGLGALCLALTPVVTWALNLSHWYSAAMLAVTIVPISIMGGQAGVLQGEHRWRPLAGIYLAVGVGRLGLGAVFMLISPTTPAAMTGIALGAFLPAIVGALALGHVGWRGRDCQRVGGQGARLLREVGTNSYAILAFFALSNTDVVMARIALDGYQAGLYASGLILTKAVLFLPQFVVVIAFPSMATPSSQHRMYLRGLATVAIMGLLATVGAAVLAQVPMPFGDGTSITVGFIGGSAYSEVSSYVWLFALLGTFFAMAQLMTYEVVARQHRASVLILWAGLVCVVGAGLLAGDAGTLAVWVCVVNGGVLTVLLGTALLHPAMGGQPPGRSAPRAQSEG